MEEANDARLLQHRHGVQHTINEIIQGRAEITSDAALQFERVLGIPAHFWLNFERRYRESFAHQRERVPGIASPHWSQVKVRQRMSRSDRADARWGRGAA